MPRKMNSEFRVEEYKRKYSNPRSKFLIESDENDRQDDLDPSISIEDVTAGIGNTTGLVGELVHEMDQQLSSRGSTSSEINFPTYKTPPLRRESTQSQNTVQHCTEYNSTQSHHKSTPYRPATPSPNKLNSNSKSLNSSAKAQDFGGKSQNRSDVAETPKVFMTPKGSSTMINLSRQSPDVYQIVNFESLDKNNNERFEKQVSNTEDNRDTEQNLQTEEKQVTVSTIDSIKVKHKKTQKREELSDEKVKKVLKKRKRRITSRSKYRLAKLKIKQYKAENLKLLAENTELKKCVKFYKMAVAKLADFSIGNPDSKFEAVSSFEGSSQEN